MFMFELLAPPTKAQLDSVRGDKRSYDVDLRPRLMIQAIEELQEAGVEPDVWKIEGLDSREKCERIVAVALRGGRRRVGCIILGRGEDDAQVHRWLETAAGLPGFIGFAVGRTCFWEPLILAQRKDRAAGGGGRDCATVSGIRGHFRGTCSRCRVKAKDISMQEKGAWFEAQRPSRQG